MGYLNLPWVGSGFRPDALKNAILAELIAVFRCSKNYKTLPWKSVRNLCWFQPVPVYFPFLPPIFLKKPKVLLPLDVNELSLMKTAENVFYYLTLG